MHIDDESRIKFCNDFFHAKNYRMKALGFRYAEADGYGCLIRDDGYTALPTKDTIVVQHPPLIETPRIEGQLHNRRVYVANRTDITFLGFAAHAPHTRLAFQSFAWKIAKHGIYTGEIVVDVLNMTPKPPPLPDDQPFNRATFSEIGSVRKKQANSGLVTDSDRGLCLPRYVMIGRMEPIAPPDGYENVIATYAWEMTEAHPRFDGCYLPTTSEADEDEGGTWEDETP